MEDAGGSTAASVVVSRLVAAKQASGKTLGQIAAETGLTNVYVAQLFRRQAQLKPDTAASLRSAVPNLSDELLSEMMAPPFRSYNPNIIQEPAIYRINEAVMHFGESIKEIINEDFGDGIMSAIDFYCSVDKVKGVDGKDRVVVTFDGKYLPYSEQRSEHMVSRLTKRLKLLSQPVLLPCDHILCSRCSGISTNDKFNCPDCRLPYELKDLRSAKHIEKFCTNYQHMSSAISTLLQDFELSFTRTSFPCNKQAEKKHAHITEDESFVDQRQLSPPIDNFKESDSDSWGKEAQFGAKRKFADIFTAVGPNCDTKLAKLHDSNESRKHLDGSAIETCVFCHSFRTTEASGDMLHYLNEKPVSGDQVLQPNVIHVHRKCIEWAPQVYYSGETAVNLEAEITRSSKIKCCSCGLKGAALGCYIKNCRRSFHVPCAYKILECRWDTDNYLVLCPVHASFKLPCDKLKPKKSKNAYVTITREASVLSEYDGLSTEKKRHGDWMSSFSVCKDWLICGSGLSKEDKVCLDYFAKMSGLVVTYQWKHNVTHVIAATDESGACIRTMKYLMAILSGRWVLNMRWIRACLEVKQLVPEEHFEISHDIHGCFDGPKTGRLQALQKAPKLFDKLAFHFCDFTESSYQSHLESLAAAAGGKLVCEYELHKLKAKKTFIVYCVEPPNDCGSAEFKEVLLERIDAAETLAAKAGGTAVRHTVFLNAIAAHDLNMLPEKL